jgi:transcriptional repressor NrdR
MICPHCHQNASRVLDSRASDGGHAIRRRRECTACGYRFTTFERVETVPLLVVKRDGRREEFNRDKILRGLVRAAEKRPLSSKQLNDLTDSVTQELREQDEHEVSSRKIGQMVMDRLAKLDDVAYIRFASVYRQFTDVSGFMKALYEMIDERKKGD